MENIKRKKTGGWLWAGITFIVAFLCMVMYGYLQDQEVFKMQAMECGEVVYTNFQALQYQNQFSFGRVKFGTGKYKSFKIADYVEPRDFVCKSGMGWIKKDEYQAPEVITGNIIQTGYIK